MTKIYALRDEVIIKPLELDRTASGIYLVKNAKDNNLGIVVAIGAGFKDKALKVGMKIIYRKNEGVRFKLDGELYLKLRSRWCEAIVGSDEICWPVPKAGGDR